MKIVHPICCGMDIHKNIIVATIATTDSNGITTYKQSTFSTMNNDVIKLRDWLLSHNCRYACMESTGKYWIPIWNILEKKINLTFAHPKYTKATKGKKTDKKDSKWIAGLFKLYPFKYPLNVDFPCSISILIKNLSLIVKFIILLFSCNLPPHLQAKFTIFCFF